MGTIAKGEITLSPVNDAYTVLLTPATCTIRADFDGSNPVLGNANTTIVVKRGAKAVDFKVTTPHISTSGIEFSYVKQADKSLKLVINKIPNTILNGWVSVDIITEDGSNYSTNIQFNFIIVRESTMLDWIQDWEGSKTKVGGTYIMTPKLFVGKKEDVIKEVNGTPVWKEGALTGVYIGPDLLKSGESSVGIYGYLKDQEIFHLNADGGFIGGWTFNEGGLQSSNGVVNILAEGTIFAQNPKSTTPYWGIYADGHATFANGNVTFQADGSATFNGTINAKAGQIGGWYIGQTSLYNSHILMDATNYLIGIRRSQSAPESGAPNFNTFVSDIQKNGGIRMYYSNLQTYGLDCWIPTGAVDPTLNNTALVFSLGSTNYIAGWNFDHRAIWTGDANPSLNQGTYTGENALTISTSGIRSNKWYVDANGTASFVGGSVKFNTENASMFGWLMRDGRFSSKHAALVSNESYCGLYISPSDLSEINVSSLVNTINTKGGIYLYSDGSNSIMRAYDKNGNMGFYLSTAGYNKIACWNFDNVRLYVGQPGLVGATKYAFADSLVLSASGIHASGWYLLADGSGSLASGNISWTADGTVTFSKDVKLAWSSITGGPNLTKIDANGIYTGTISANNITAGTISTATVKSKNGTWSLNDDGSGSLASGGISWSSDGTLEIKGIFRAPWVERVGSSFASGDEEFVKNFNKEQSQWSNLIIHPDDLLPHRLLGGNSAVNIGRLVRILNYRYPTACIDMDQESSNCGFCENGATTKQLYIKPGELVELIGYSQAGLFRWIVLNRVQFASLTS